LTHALGKSQEASARRGWLADMSTPPKSDTPFQKRSTSQFITAVATVAASVTVSPHNSSSGHEPAAHIPLPVGTFDDDRTSVVLHARSDSIGSRSDAESHVLPGEQLISAAREGCDSLLLRLPIVDGTYVHLRTLLPQLSESPTPLLTM